MSEAEDNIEQPKRVKKTKYEEISDVVSAYLQRRNYPKIQPNKRLPITAKEFMVSSLIDSDVSRPNSILYSCLNNDPIMIDKTFTKFVSWLNELVKAKSQYEDLEQLVAPLLFHFYFEILRGGHTERAVSFVKLHLPVVDKLKCEDIILDLVNAFAKEHVNGDIFNLKETFRSGKYTVQLSTASVNILRKFLEDVHLVLLNVLQNWFTIEEMVEEVEGMDVENEVEQEKKETHNRYSDKSRRKQRLQSIMNAVKNVPSDIYYVNICNTRDDVTSGVLSRDHGILAYSYNNVIRLRSLQTLMKLQSTSAEGDIMLLGHSAQVYDLEVFNNYLISCSQDRTVRLYDLCDYSEKQVYYGHDYAVYCLGVSKNNQFFISGSSDRSVRLWSCHRKDSLRTFIGHTRDITSVAFHPNSNYIVSGSTDKNIKMWALSNAQPVRSFPGSTGTIYSVAFSNDGNYLFSTGEDRMLRIWDLQGGKELLNFQVSNECGLKIALSSTERFIAVGSADGKVSVWNFDGMLKRSSKGEPVLSISFHPKVLNLDYCYGSFGCLTCH